MAFTYHQFDKGQTPPIEYLPPTASEVFSVGEALVLSGGAATKCGATAVPAYICTGPKNDAGMVPATRVQKDIVYDVPLSAAGTALKIGDKVTLHTDGLSVTATTASGVAEITGMTGTAPGDLVQVRF